MGRNSAFGRRIRAARALRCGSSSLEERLCDCAAAEMLMPEKFFRPLATALEPTIDSLLLLSKQFGASARATIVRLGQLSVWPVIFVAWRFTSIAGKGRKLRVCWSSRPAGTRCYVPNNAAADDASGIYATFVASHPTCEVERLDLGSLRGKYVVENVRVGEYVISIVHDQQLQRRI